MANGVFHTGHGIEINLTYEDLGNPGYAGLLEEITQPVDQRARNLLQCLKDYRGEECQCALAGKSPWMFVRRRRSHGQVTWVAAHLPLTHAATPQESDKHKAMEERIARTAARHGLDVETEARSSDGRVVIIRGGVRHLQIWKCTPSSERPCPTAGGACRMWHSGWFLPALCIPQERATALDELVVTSADGEHLPVRSRDPQDARRTSYLWALARDVDRWREITAEAGDTSEPGPVDDEPVTYREQELDSSCRYGEEGPHTGSPRPLRDRASAIGLHTFGRAPADALLQPSRPVALRLSPRERLVVAAELRCPPWEVGPCMLCAAPIHRYGPRSPKVCPACRMTTSS
ncbi:hypothetical protein OJ963_40480 [Streptomyces sp. RS2]|uniref:hypothetical protein n=1 Tax=Streptomyces sp. RS2 TaxID=1451205 RepID=UPI0021F87872|nr:hypothetical protein [Streptomyces sp. RS2]MCW1100069.1 hypothetical protein [Streptomyces sp. RS2]